MKTQIRFCTFETNSSSTHAVAILSDEEYKKYQNGELKLDRYGDPVDIDAYNKEYAQNLERAKKLFEVKASDCKYYDSPEEMAEEDTDGDFDCYDMEVIHEQRNINGVNVHAISIYGYDS